jgi:hypothetical protein
VRRTGLDEILGGGGELAALAARPSPAGAAVADDEIGAIELVHQASASDIGTATVEHLEHAADRLAIAYLGTRPAMLLDRVRAHIAYVTQLLDARKTLDEHRRLLAVGGWLSLLAATCLIDLGRPDAAESQLRAAAHMARETGHRELGAWCLETRVWQVLINGRYRQAVELARGAQHAAPRGSSVYIQATAQEGRALARLGEAKQTYGALARVETLVSPLPVPEHPEHHYRYDPAKSQAYVATTLSWLGDPAAENHARQVLARVEPPVDGPPHPRRAASARLDLALTLTATGHLDEAAATACDAVTSRLLVPSNYWRAEEVITAVTRRGVPEGQELREAYRGICGAPPNDSARKPS